MKNLDFKGFFEKIKKISKKLKKKLAFFGNLLYNNDRAKEQQTKSKKLSG